MKHSRAAIRYARAALEIARDKGALDLVEKDMRSILRTLAGPSELKDILGSPVIEGAVKKEAIQAVFKGLHGITKGLIALLVDNRRIVLLNEVALKYVLLNEELKGQDVAYITTAVPLTPEIEKKALKQLAAITDKKVTLENRIDPALIGGFILRLGDIQYDASIASKLNNIKREFTKSL